MDCQLGRPCTGRRDAAAAAADDTPCAGDHYLIRGSCCGCYSAAVAEHTWDRSRWLCSRSSRAGEP